MTKKYSARRLSNFMRPQKNVIQTKDRYQIKTFSINKGAEKVGNSSGKDLEGDGVRLTPVDKDRQYWMPDKLNDRGEPDEGYKMGNFTLDEVFKLAYGNAPASSSNPITVRVMNLNEAFSHTTDPKKIEDAVRAMVIIQAGGITPNGKFKPDIVKSDPYWQEIVFMRKEGYGRYLEEHERIPVWLPNGEENPKAIVFHDDYNAQKYGFKKVRGLLDGTEGYLNAYIVNGQKKAQFLPWKFTINLQLEFYKIRNFVSGIGEANITGKYDMSKIVQELTRVALLCAKHRQPFDSMKFLMYRAKTEAEIPNYKKGDLTEARAFKMLGTVWPVVLRLSSESETQLKLLEEARKSRAFEQQMLAYKNPVKQLEQVNDLLGLPSGSPKREVEPEITYQKEEFDDEPTVPDPSEDEQEPMEGEIVDEPIAGNNWFTRENILAIANASEKDFKFVLGKILGATGRKGEIMQVAHVALGNVGMSRKPSNVDNLNYQVTAFVNTCIKQYGDNENASVTQALEILEEN